MSFFCCVVVASLFVLLVTRIFLGEGCCCRNAWSDFCGLRAFGFPFDETLDVHSAPPFARRVPGVKGGAVVIEPANSDVRLAYKSAFSMTFCCDRRVDDGAPFMGFFRELFSFGLLNAAGDFSDTIFNFEMSFKGVWAGIV